MAALRIPSATYRLQLNNHFRFEDARALAPYLHELGITDVYASPVLQSRRGSEHGYDVTDPTRLNSELGTEDEFKAWVEELHRSQMGLVLDIVPNHVAAIIENPWWTDVLENGPGSAYAAYFDIDWHPPSKTLENKVLLPVLAERYAEALEGCKLTLTLEERGFIIRYADMQMPVAPKSYSRILGHRLEDLEQTLGKDAAALREIKGILAAVTELPERVGLSSEISGERRRGQEAIKERLWDLYQSSQEVRSFLDENLRIVNGHKGKPASFMILDALLSEQAYVLSYWRAANEEINYRRFFAIIDLVGVRVEDPLVFDATHAAVLKLVRDGGVSGLRIDHIDGLRDPLGYLRRLQEHISGAEDTGGRFYTIVEKILAHHETLPENWPVFGTTGYDFLNVMNELFIDQRGRRSLEDTYARFLGHVPGYEDLIYQKKMQIMETILSVEMRSLGHRLSLLAESDRYARDLTQADLTQALTAVTAALPVYRTYARSAELASAERRYIAAAISAARQRNPELDPACLDFLSDLLLLRGRVYVSAAQQEARLGFVMRWQQSTGPIMAKGFEDTVLYIYNPLVSLNEVGSAHFSDVSVAGFHDFCGQRMKRWPHTLNASTTHDTKRSEDVRARLNVLAEIPGEWKQHLQRWARWNRKKKTLLDGRPAPDRNEEILLYQTMLGAWPLEAADIPGFANRLKDYLVKATREAKVHTKWTRPNFKHERALSHFVDRLMGRRDGGPFWDDFTRFQRRISYCGALNGLSQVALKIAAPGIPDFYQGSELWDFRLVDPDNRRPVDFEKRIRLLEEIKARARTEQSNLLADLLEHWEDGRAKLYLISKMLGFRRAHRQLFEAGHYLPVKVAGTRRLQVCSFMRHYGKEWALIVAPRLISRVVRQEKMPLGLDAWGRTNLILGRRAPATWKNVLGGERLTATKVNRQTVLPLASVLSRFPVALLEVA